MLLRPKDWTGSIPVTCPETYNGRTYLVTHWSGRGGLWTVEPDDDVARLIRANTRQDAIREYERED